MGGTAGEGRGERRGKLQLAMGNGERGLVPRCREGEAGRNLRCRHGMPSLGTPLQCTVLVSADPQLGVVRDLALYYYSVTRVQRYIGYRASEVEMDSKSEVDIGDRCFNCGSRVHFQVQCHHPSRRWKVHHVDRMVMQINLMILKFSEKYVPVIQDKSKLNSAHHMIRKLICA